MNKQHSSPCKECPFSRLNKVDGLGGASPETYIGQAMGNFFLPCHMDPDYYKDRRSTNLRQCAGAAIYRANIGVSAHLAQQLLKLPENREKVFGSPEEFLAHYTNTSIQECQARLRITTPIDLLRNELSKSGVEILAILKKK